MNVIKLNIKKNIIKYIVFGIIMIFVIYMKLNTISGYQVNNLDSAFWFINHWFDEKSSVTSIISIILLISPYALLQSFFGDTLLNDIESNGFLIFARYKRRTKYLLHFTCDCLLIAFVLMLITMLSEIILIFLLNFEYFSSLQNIISILQFSLKIFTNFFAIIIITNVLSFILKDTIRATMLILGIALIILIFNNLINFPHIVGLFPVLFMIFCDKYVNVISVTESVLSLLLLFCLIKNKDIY